MSASPVLLPLPWWIIPVIALFIIVGTYIAAKCMVQLSNRRFAALGPHLVEAGVVAGSDGISMQDGHNGIVVSGERIVVIDMRDARMVHTISLHDTSAIKIYEDQSDRIRFRLVSSRGAQSRLITTNAIADFASFFALMIRAGKTVEYIQE